MAPFYRLPSMRKLTGQMVCGRVSELVPPNSSITHLELRQSSTSSGFAELIAPCTNLKSFRYFHMDCFEHLRSPYNQRFSYHRPSEFMAPLAEKADTFLGTFAHFHVLKHLGLRLHEMAKPMLLRDQLPPSLERLSVTEWGACDYDDEKEDVSDCMVQFAASKNHFPNLTNIEIHQRYLIEYKGDASSHLAEIRSSVYPGRYALPDTKRIYDDTEELAAVCKQMGIVLTIHDADTEGYLHGFENYFRPFYGCGEE